MRRGKKAKNSALVTHMKGHGFSDSVFVKLDYVDRKSLTPASPVESYAFAGNSLYDPDVSGAGHQPLYFDQYALIYQKYRVLGCKISLDIINVSGNSALYYVVEPNTTQSTLTSLSEILEQSRATAPKFVPIAQRIASKHQRYISTRKVCGLTKSQLFDDTFGALTTANPNNLWYWNLFFQSADNASNVACDFIVKLTYYVQFFDKINTAQS